MRILGLAATFVAVAAGSGCAGNAQRQAEADNHAVAALCDVALQDPRLVPLHDVIPVNADDASVSQLANPALFTSTQKRALADIDDVMAQCYTAKIQWANKYEPPIGASIYQAFFQQERVLRARAIRDDTGIGQFNEARAALLSKSNEMLAGARQQHAHQQAEEAARAAAAWAAFNTSLQQTQQTQIMQQQLNQQQMQMNRPVTTNCSRIGYQVNCTTW
ncbi:hypothetical protein [Achromobacter insolitus]|uniref:Lipoprotein n=1 Tax=Achromobacter insolitus TaxID=217204 RepID=A0A6S7F4Y8_9BURK|nr:hypothetical protein [Achromobacter insolitus]CAB3931590.1 hypothetical protein LMG6000_02230 [Achromobacter insolitus]CAB3939461.1 hypothetical protein LMG5997_04047 [Achromobacter insolitus]